MPGAGQCLSIRAVTGKPIKFLGVGEKLDALELFHPDRMASRILGMGDVLSLIEKAQEILFARAGGGCAEAADQQYVHAGGFPCSVGAGQSPGFVGPDFGDVARWSEAQGGDGRADTGARDETSHGDD